MAVVEQSYQEGIGATLDISFLNKLDCFHPSELGHEDLAIGLWNSMLCHSRADRCSEVFSRCVPLCSSPVYSPLTRTALAGISLPLVRRRPMSSTLDRTSSRARLRRDAPAGAQPPGLSRGACEPIINTLL